MMAPSCTHCTKISIKLHMMCTNSKTPNQNVMYLTLTLTLLTHIIIKKWKRMIRFRTVGGYSFLRRGWRRRGGGGRAGGGREGGEGGGGLQLGALQLQAEVMGYCWRPRSSSDQPDAAAKIDKKYFVVRLVNLLATKGALCLTPPSRLPCYVFSVFVC